MEEKKKIVLLFGPYIKSEKGTYGGGVGGYTRKMMLYLNFFSDEKVKQIPCFHTIRGQLNLDFFIVRFIVDISRFIGKVISKKPDVVHILGHYFISIYREVAIVAIAKIFGIKILYEMKGGGYHTWYMNTHFLNKWATKFCLRNADVVTGQGMPYVNFVEREIKREAHFYPNFVPSNQIEAYNENKFSSDVIKFLFVGYAYNAKGVYEAVRSLVKLAKNNRVEMYFVGKEEEEFSKWLDNVELPNNLIIKRVGILSNEKAHEYFTMCDVYLYPTYHEGEGHNNSINEAMMYGMAIVTTKKGFIGSVLNDEIAFFVEERNEDHLYNTLVDICESPMVAKSKGKKAYQHLLKNYTTDIAFKKLSSFYHSLI